MSSTPVSLYDTTLRDGSQRRGISFSVEDKLKVTKSLDLFGIHYIEGGWPGSNPKDCEYFERAQDLSLIQARLAAFGATRRAKSSVQTDTNLKALLEAHTPVVTVVGKSSPFQVKEILRTDPDENLAMIAESIAWLKEHNREVIYDAEHFFDGFHEDPEYSLKTLIAAQTAGANTLVLCDTNGGTLPSSIQTIVKQVQHEVDVELGIHCHNDCELAVANTIAAIEAGCTHSQGTINGYGERCGNANLIAIIPILKIKLGMPVVSTEALTQLTALSRQVSDIANLIPDEHAPFVGQAAFAHKGGIHVAAIERNPRSYEHIDPKSVGNHRHFLISELSGRGNVRLRAQELGLQPNGNEHDVLEQIKQLESKGFQFEDAEGSFELMLRRAEPGYRRPFELIDMMEVTDVRSECALRAKALIKIQVGTEHFHTAGEGDGPVHAVDHALRKALLPTYPQLNNVHLIDYKVRILNPQEATAATTRVMIEAADQHSRWTTVGCSNNIIEASFRALSDSYELFLVRQSK